MNSTCEHKLPPLHMGKGTDNLMNKYFTITRCKTNQEIELIVEFEISLLGLYDSGGWYFFIFLFFTMLQYHWIDIQILR